MRRLNMDLVRRVKEEPIMIDSEDDEAHASSSPQNAASNHPAEEDDESLLELRPAQFCKLKFPPPCAVVYTDFNSDPPTVVFTSVQTAYVNIDTHKFVYKLKSGNLVQEEDLLFSKGVPAWAFIGGDFIPATVLAVSQKTSGEAAYTVQDVDSRTLHHFLKTQAVRYRRDATKPALPESLKQDESTTKEESEESSKKEEQEEPSPRINERSTPQVVRPDQMKESMSATPPHQGEAGRHESSNHHTAVKEPMTPATTRHKNDNLEASILRPLRSSREKIVQVKEPAKAQPKLQPRFRAREMVSEMQPPAKRFKNLPFRRLFRLPNWVSRASLQTCFGRPDRSVLEAKTKCKVSLSITDTSRIVNIDGDEENVNAAVEQVEDFLLTCIHGDNHKLMFMYDLAWINLSGDFKPGDILFQREKEVWKYMCVLELPFASREGFDLMKKEIMEMKRETECHFRLFRLITARLYISHESKAALEQSVLRARERIQQVNFMLQTMRGY